MSDLRENTTLPSHSLETIQRTVLVAILHAAAKRLHPAVLHEMVLGVGIELGRQAAAEYRLARHLIGRLDSYACAQCLEAIGKQFQWTLRVSVESSHVIRIVELGCAAAKFGRPDPYLLEVGYGILGGIVADELGYAKVCMFDHPEMPPFHRTMTIYVQESAESRATSGIVFPRIVDETAQFAERPSHDRPVEHLTPRETEVYRLIAQGLHDKEIAAALHLSVRTVENHAARIRQKLGVGSRMALVRFALRAPVNNR